VDETLLSLAKQIHPPEYERRLRRGRKLGIGRPTVKTHVQHIYKKLGVSTRAGAVKRAEHAGWIQAREERP
jgi:hypothetical protein